MLDDIFNEIDKLEKTKLDVQQYTQTDEDYMRWAWLALILFVIEIVLRYTVLRRIP
jgi:Ca-activated chloride channel family protein